MAEPDTYRKTREAVFALIERGKDFSGSDVEKAVEEAGGIFRVSPFVSPWQYLDGEVSRGRLGYHQGNDTYFFPKKSRDTAA